MNRHWQIAFVIAVLNDALDYAGMAALPFVGDILDVATSALLWHVLGGKYALPTGIELVPGADFLPFYTVTVGAAYLNERRKKRDKESDSEIQ